MRKSFTLLAIMLMTNVLLTNATEVFSVDFNHEVTPEGWSISDANGDGISWEINSQLNGYIYNGMNTTQPANDWLFTPSFKVEANKYYLLTYTVAQRGAYGSDFITISYGKSGDAQEMKSVIVEDEYNMHGGMLTRCRRLAFPESASYVMGIKITSSPDNGIVSLKSISLVESQPCHPQAVPAMVANMDSETQTVKLKWINPRKDIEDVYIVNQMNALIYEDDILVETIEGVAPGKVQEYNLKPTLFEGKHNISIAVVVDGLESEKVSKTIDYDDIKGSPEPIYTFPLTKDEFASWSTINVDNDFAQWQYDARSVYISALGKDVNDWVITPGYELEAGKRYALTYELASGRDYPASLDVTMGTQQNTASQTTVLTSYTDLYQNGYGVYQSPQFEVESAGTYYFGFHALYVGNSLDLRNVTINTINTGGDVQEEELVYQEPEEEVLADNINGDLDVQVPYHQRLSSEGIELYAAYTNALLDEYTLAPLGIYHLVQQEGEFEVDFTNPDLTINLAGGATYHDGKIYCNEYDGSSNYQEEYPTWKVIDARSYEVLSQTTLNNNCENTTISLAYDATTDKIYGFVKDYIDTYLVEVDPMTGAMTRMGDRLNYQHRYLAIGCNVHGELYCVYMTEDNITGDQTQYLARINKNGGEIATIGEISGLNLMSGDWFINMKMRQSLFFNNQTGKMYWYFCSSSSALGSQYGAIFELNTLNANAILQTWRTDVFAISGAFFAEPGMQAPGIITDVDYQPETVGALSGTLTFNLPTTTYSGQELSSKLSYQVLMAGDRSEVFAGEGMPGETISCHHVGEEAIYELILVAHNEYGVGVEKEYTFLVGYDEPGAPENLLLSDKDWTTIVLTWDAPSQGIHGEPYDASKLTYNVYTYPDLELVAEGLTDTRYEKQCGNEMTRHIYAVFSCHEGTPTKGYLSNDVVIGTPLETPYGGVFNVWTDMYNYYTILDVNKDDYTWSFDGTTGAAFYPYNYQQDADDWMISPPIRCYEGDTYQLQFSAFSTSDEYPESLLVTFGNGKTTTAQCDTLMNFPELPAIDDESTVNVYSVDITVPQSGVYYYGFKAYSPMWYEYLYLYNVTFTKRVDGSTPKVEAYNRDFDAYYYNNGITVINPSNRPIAIYNVNGTLMHSSEVGEYHVQLTPGVYVARSAQSAVKIIVR